MIRIGFRNEPVWQPGFLSREEERACWVQKVTCLDQQAHCLEQAAFFCRLAKQSDALLQLWDVDVRGAETRGAGELRQPGETEPGLAKTRDHEHQRVQPFSALSGTHVTSGANAETELLQESPRPRPAVLHGTLRQPKETEPRLASTNGKKWRWSADHEDPEGSLETLATEDSSPLQKVEPKTTRLATQDSSPRQKVELKTKTLATEDSLPRQKVELKTKTLATEDSPPRPKVEPETSKAEPLPPRPKPVSEISGEPDIEPQDVEITVQRFNKFGATKYCKACEKGGPANSRNHHNPLCRKRFAYLEAGYTWEGALEEGKNPPPVQNSGQTHVFKSGVRVALTAVALPSADLE